MVLGMIGWWCWVCGGDSNSCMVVYVVGMELSGCGGVYVLLITVVVNVVAVVMVLGWWGL